MNMSVAEKVLEGSLFSKLSDFRYFIMFAAFGLYWDSFLRLTSEIGLAHLAYKFSDAFPLGDIFILFGSFSVVASLLSPLIFWTCQLLLWCISDEIKDAKPSLELVSKTELKLWAVKKNNSVALSLINAKNAENLEILTNRPQPFLLLLCIIGNYFLTPNGILQTIHKSFSIESKAVNGVLIFAFFFLLFCLAFRWDRYDFENIKVDGLKKHLSDQNPTEVSPDLANS